MCAPTACRHRGLHELQVHLIWTFSSQTQTSQLQKPLLLSGQSPSASKGLISCCTELTYDRQDCARCIHYHVACPVAVLEEEWIIISVQKSLMRQSLAEYSITCIIITKNSKLRLFNYFYFSATKRHTIYPSITVIHSSSSLFYF